MKRRLMLGVALALFVVAVPSLAQEGVETFGYTTPNLPANYNQGTEPVDAMYNFILYLTGAVFVAVFVCMIWFLVQYRHQPGRRAVFIHGNQKLEMVWTLIPALIMALIAAFSQSLWSQMKSPELMPRGDDVVQVHVMGRQFNWFFHYPGPDGKFGQTDVHWRQNTGNPAEEIGLRRGFPEDFMSEAQLQALRDDKTLSPLLEPDPAAYDDVCTAVMYVPAGKKVHIEITSKDVLHSFFVPNFRMKQDAVPGLVGHLWIHPYAAATSANIVGRDSGGQPKPYDIVCAELCGSNHYKMRGQLFVVTEEEYEQWLEENASDPAEFSEE